jgi:hypothetical protein
VGPGGRHGRHGLLGEARPGAVAGDGHDVVPGEPLGSQYDRHDRDRSHRRGRIPGPAASSGQRRTEAGVKAMQGFLHVAVDGIVGAVTWQALVTNGD